jgi:hypothetical protein
MDMNTTTTSLIQTPRCIYCGETGALELSNEGIAKYENGSLIQYAFPELHRSLREQLITGTHPKCWKEMFGNP